MIHLGNYMLVSKLNTGVSKVGWLRKLWGPLREAAPHTG